MNVHRGPTTTGGNNDDALKQRDTFMSSEVLLVRREEAGDLFEFRGIYFHQTGNLLEVRWQGNHFLRSLDLLYDSLISSPMASV